MLTVETAAALLSPSQQPKQTAKGTTTMKIKVIRNRKHSGKKLKIDDVLDLPESEASVLIAHGTAVAVTAEDADEHEGDGKRGKRGKGKE